MTNVHEILAQRRQAALQRRDRRVEELYRRHPGPAKLREERLQKGRALLGQAMRMSERERERAQEAMHKLLAEEKEAWNALGVSSDAFEPHFTCSDCEDTGFVDGVSCHCRNALLAAERYDMSAIRERLSVENFKNFNLTLFRRDRQANEPCSPYENMADLKQRMEKEYVPTFSRRSPNLYFYGPTGTGKTFLVNCIVKGVLDQGAQVYYQTAPQLLDFLTTYSFSYARERTEKEQARHDFAYTCDLLVVDDLGTEYLTDKMNSELFELINSRIVAQRPTILSSNVQLEELGEIYGERIASRIAGEYIAFPLFGSDIRRM